MKDNSKYIIPFLVGVAVAVVLGSLQLPSGDDSLGALSNANNQLWRLSGGDLQPVLASWGLTIPGLAAADECLVIDASGVVSTLACGGSSEWTDNGAELEPNEGEGIKVDYVIATSTATTSEFGNLNVGTDIGHIGDLNTFIRFLNDGFSLVAGGTEYIEIPAGGVSDFRFPILTTDGLLQVSGSDGSVTASTSISEAFIDSAITRDSELDVFPILAGEADYTGTHDFDGATIAGMQYYPAFTYATTSWSGTTTIPLGVAYNAQTWAGVKCFTDVGTVYVEFNDGTNAMNDFQASTTVGTITLSSNNSFTAGEKRYVDVGTPATSPTKISCTISNQDD